MLRRKDAQFNRATAMEHDLSSPNYYAIKIAPGIHYTMGGVKINTNTEVLDKENQPIRGYMLLVKSQVAYMETTGSVEIQLRRSLFLGDKRAYKQLDLLRKMNEIERK